MTATLLYRIAAVLLILLATVHTFGSLTFTPPTPEARAVRDAMNNVHFEGNYSYGNFYRGFALSITVYLLFLGFLAWHLGSVAAKTPEAIGALGWVFCGSQLATVVVAAIYIEAVPAISFGVVGACLALAAWRVPAAKARDGSQSAASPG
jgi:hypothetical protein